MLILTRRVNETLTIGNEITVTVLGVNRNQVKLDISAPKNVSVHRKEIYARIQLEEVGLDNNAANGSKNSVPVCIIRSKGT